MSKSSLLTRTMTAVVSVPLLVSAIVFFPQYHHLFFSLIVVFVTAAGTWELKNNIIKRRIKTPPTAYLGSLLPLIEIINLNFLDDVELTPFLLASFIGISFLVEIFNGEKDNFTLSLERIGATVLNIVYPGLLMMYGVRICYLPYPRTMIILFLCIVFGSDSFAYFGGILFGKNNKGVVKCSPNKSIAGFIGGTIIISLVGVAVVLIFPSLLPFSALEIFILFLLTSIFGTAGDLFESMLKRSAGVKDAGVMVPGRGGMLDCIDSLSVAAPIFTLLVEIMLL